MEPQVIREAKSLHHVKPVLNNLLVRYKYEAKGMIITNKDTVGNMIGIEKIIVGYGETTLPRYDIGVAIVTKANCFSLQPVVIKGNDKSVASVVKSLNPISKQAATKIPHLILNESTQADQKIDLAKVYTMYEYYLINEGDVLATDTDVIVEL